ncbi:MAG: methyltransferase domain-containing protein [Deltaproteobacteria bacterium]|nr:methyltransferase domain-containing protein [Deltaproteobacteria bacterium]
MADHNERILDQFTRQAVPFSTAAPIRDAAALQLLVDAAGTAADDTVLDVACGPGLVACAFAHTARHVTGIDLTPAMLERGRALAAEQGLSNVTFQRGNVLPLPFADASFSIVVSRFAFHHFQDPAAVLAEMRRVCRPGGRVVVADLLASSDPAKAAAFHRMEMLRDPSHARALTLDELRGLFAAAAFAPPDERFWQMQIDVEDLLERSFPVAGSVPTIRQMFADAVADDGMGLNTRREHGRVRFTYFNAVLTAAR